MPTTNDPHIIEILEQEMKHITDLTRRNMTRYPLEERVDEVDDMAQQALIKLWRALQKGHIANPAAYATTIVSSVCIDRQRRYKPIYTHFDQGVDDLYDDQEHQDLACHIEHMETMATFVQIATQAILMLPPRQKLAIVCALKDRFADAEPLLTALEAQGVDVAKVCWPDNISDKQLLRASLAVARKKLRCILSPSLFES
ncbi:hypothetical protein KSF_064020 [Reticulibacter mediterranei]|uniref:RNA polymerase sigma-70 region 2 domain-containing protein n=1 Tax=Reticulibacter mediterranei TaxID=2778369 RepID=A0A8J3N2R3_9CHLR|nr:sigma-70 family RNA polymerase sigma factor [Reticulibacter mediterranei]GHO96354.1 hypothetical protein KSF_064020 [Reticulibacter mediterranei]